MPFDSAYHAPVLAGEVNALLGDRQHVLDCTLGGGGHTIALLEQGVGSVIGIDRDADALAVAGERLARFAQSGRFRGMLANYAALDSDPNFNGLEFDGILLDLGISSHQIDVTDRGFTFRPGAPLDMRMGADASIDAATLLNTADLAELGTIFRDYGDEPRALRLAREIVRRRERSALATSDDLVGAIRGALGPRTGPADFARLFQAVRIAVNEELSGLERALPALRDRLEPNGILVVIAYHSGEDRIAKNAFREWSAACVCPPKQPVCSCRGRPLGTTITKRAVSASEDEIHHNPRARSARLRAWRKAAA